LLQIDGRLLPQTITHPFRKERGMNGAPEFRFGYG
jgi:hypothetical protein